MASGKGDRLGGLRVAVLLNSSQPAPQAVAVPSGATSPSRFILGFGLDIVAGLAHDVGALTLGVDAPEIPIAATQRTASMDAAKLRVFLVMVSPCRLGVWDKSRRMTV
jgi:hypothetical protein